MQGIIEKKEVKKCQILAGASESFFSLAAFYYLYFLSKKYVQKWKKFLESNRSLQESIRGAV